MMTTTTPFYNQKYFFAFSDYLKSIFNEKVYKVTLDAGFSCPNRDGTISNSGCIFCDNGGSFSQLWSANQPISKQLQDGIAMIRDRFDAKKFLGYFQAYSNTYKPVNELKKIYDEVFTVEDVVGMSIGTRPDCVDEEKLDLIASYLRHDRFIQVEYGIQSIHDKSLLFMNRGHDFACSQKACKLTQERNIDVCTHVILGLPTENRQDMLETAEKLADMKINSVKLHMLVVLENTKLKELYEQGLVPLMSEEEYVELVCDFLELLPPTTTIQRMTGNGLRFIRIEPQWLGRKWDILNKINNEFARRKTYQGYKYMLKNNISMPV